MKRNIKGMNIQVGKKNAKKEYIREKQINCGKPNMVN